jgi:single-strand DNA-binding protein
MASLNKVMLIGNLTRQPEVRYLPSGMAVADLRMAVSRKFKAKDGQLKDDTCFVSVSVFDRQAETCSQYLTKGSPVLIEGRLKYDEWEKEGQKFNRITVVAERVQFLSSPSKGAEFQDGGARSASRQPPAAEEAVASADRPAAPEDTGGDADNLPF